MRLHNRMIKADFRSDPDLLQWHRDKRSTYEGLWQLADDSGCLEDSAFAFKLHLWPSPLDSDITVAVIERWIAEMVDDEKLIRYTTNKKACLFLKNFPKHQKLASPTPPEVPLPPWIQYVKEVVKRKNNREYTVGRYIYLTEDRSEIKATSKPHQSHIQSTSNDLSPIEEKRREEKGKEGVSEPAARPLPEIPSILSRDSYSRCLALEEYSRQSVGKACFGPTSIAASYLDRYESKLAELDDLAALVMNRMLLAPISDRAIQDHWRHTLESPTAPFTSGTFAKIISQAINDLADRKTRAPRGTAKGNNAPAPAAGPVPDLIYPKEVAG